MMELKQFLALLKEEIFVTLGQTNPEVDAALKLLQFPEGVVPDSKIVHDSGMSMANKALELTKKYICDDSKFAVNVHGKIRKELVSDLNDNQFEGKSAEYLYRQFGVVLLQLQALMNDSYHRFVATKRFEQLERVLSLEGKSELAHDPEAAAVTAAAAAAGDTPALGTAGTVGSQDELLVGRGGADRT